MNPILIQLINEFWNVNKKDMKYILYASNVG